MSSAAGKLSSLLDLSARNLLVDVDRLEALRGGRDVTTLVVDGRRHVDTVGLSCTERLRSKLVDLRCDVTFGDLYVL